MGRLKRVLHAREQRHQTGVTHVLDLHHPLLVGEAVHVTAEVLPGHKYSQRLGKTPSLKSNLYTCAAFDGRFYRKRLTIL